MSNQFSSGRNAIAECDRCGFRYRLHQLRKETVKGVLHSLKVCPPCWNPDHPQLKLGLYPINDPQAVREPRPDLSYYSSGLTGLNVTKDNTTALLAAGFPSEGSRQIQWGWSPVGMHDAFNETPNYLVAVVGLGSVTVTTT